MGEIEMSELQLSDKELNQLTKVSRKCFKEFKQDDEEDSWFESRVGERMFDINIWASDIENCVICCVYECFSVTKEDREGRKYADFSTDCTIGKTLWSVKQ